LKELLSYPAPQEAVEPHTDLAGIAVPLQLSTKAGLLSFISTTTVFGTPVDITLSELAIETLFPADEETAAILRSHLAN